MTEQWGKHMEVRVIESKELLETVEPFEIRQSVMGNGEDSKNIWLYWICKRRRILSQTGMSGEKSSPNLVRKIEDPGLIKTVR